MYISALLACTGMSLWVLVFDEHVDASKAKSEAALSSFTAPSWRALSCEGSKKSHFRAKQEGRYPRGGGRPEFALTPARKLAT